MRPDGRAPDQLRPIRLTTGYQKGVDGSVLVQWGDTWVLCAASVEAEVPAFRRDSGGGWVTGEYNMLPGSTRPRKARRTGGREREIQRLIGRSLRAAVALEQLGAHTITIDCDVLQADGGTRVAAITGGWVALTLAVKAMQRSGRIAADPIRRTVAAVSGGVLADRPLLDLCYEEDSQVAVDMNVVMTASGDLVEIQGTGEKSTFSAGQLSELVALAMHATRGLCDLQCRAVTAAQTEPRATVTLEGTQ